MGISRNPTMYGSRKTAGDMTWLKLHGQQIFKAVRQKGQSNPSPEYLLSQVIAKALWSVYRQTASAVRGGITSKLEKQPAASAWYKDNYATGLPGGVLSVPDMIFAKGTMTQTPVTVVAHSTDESLHFSWTNPDGIPTHEDTDLFAYVVQNVAGDAGPGGYAPFFGLVTSGTRDALSATVFPPGVPFATGDQLNIWTFFVGAPATLNAGFSESSLYQLKVAVA